jgi:hypothetical protein
MENMWDIMKVLESQEDMHNMVEVQANSEPRSLTQSLGPTCLQIDVHDASDVQFG